MSQCKGCEDKSDQGEYVWCESCHKAEVEKATETITLVKCNECEKTIAVGRGVCSRCNSQEISAAKACSIDRYPFMGIARVGPLQDRLLSFLAILSETCGCAHDSTRCARCKDAAELHAEYKHQLGEIRA